MTGAAGAERVTKAHVGDPARRERAVRDHEQAALIERLSAIREELLEVAEGWRPWIEGRDADRDASARNLLQYLALRGHDLRELQDPLVALGLSSRAAAKVTSRPASTLCCVRSVPSLDRPPAPSANPPPIRFARSRELLATRTAALLGPVPRRRPTRIMVTMPTEAAHDPGLVRECSSPGWTA